MAEAGLTKAMDQLNVSFADCSPKRLWQVTTPRPRLVAIEAAVASPNVDRVSPAHWGCAREAIGAGAVHTPGEIVTVETEVKHHSPESTRTPTSPPLEVHDDGVHHRSSTFSTPSHPQTAFSPSPSLASSLLAFSPPTPGAQQLLAASFAQSSMELEALAEAARCAATACPQSVPLVEALCAAVADELAELKVEQATATTGSTPDAKSAFELGGVCLNYKPQLLKAWRLCRPHSEHVQ
jgi:hypothetical protein